MREKAVLFGEQRSLVGVVTEPAQAREGAPAVLLLNAGLLHHVGPNRLYVRMARRLAEQGLTTLRFDFSGIGDSGPRTDAAPLDEYVVAEAREGMDHLAQLGGYERFVLGGLCLGADVAFQTAFVDERVAGLALFNPTELVARTGDAADADAPSLEESLEKASSRTQLRYYMSRAASPKSWARVLSGKSNLGAIGRALGKAAKGKVAKLGAKEEGGTRTDCAPLLERGVRTLLVYSEGSTAYDLFAMNHEGDVRALEGPELRLEVVGETDHVFTLQWAQRHLVDAMLAWMAEAGTG